MKEGRTPSKSSNFEKAFGDIDVLGKESSIS